jgi:large subunit ribosomal protein L21
MYAIVKSGGKQYRIEPGQRLLVERLSAEVGATVSLEPLLFRSEETAFEKASLQHVKVDAKVIAHERGPKLRVFKFKPKRGYKRRTGHRQELTRIEIGKIAMSAGRARGASHKSAPGRSERSRSAAEGSGSVSKSAAGRARADSSAEAGDGT